MTASLPIASPAAAGAGAGNQPAQGEAAVQNPIFLFADLLSALLALGTNESAPEEKGDDVRKDPVKKDNVKNDAAAICIAFPMAAPPCEPLLPVGDLGAASAEASPSPVAAVDAIPGPNEGVTTPPPAYHPSVGVPAAMVAPAGMPESAIGTAPVEEPAVAANAPAVPEGLDAVSEGAPQSSRPPVARRAPPEFESLAKQPPVMAIPAQNPPAVSPAPASPEAPAESAPPTPQDSAPAGTRSAPPEQKEVPAPVSEPAAVPVAARTEILPPVMASPAPEKRAETPGRPSASPASLAFAARLVAADPETPQHGGSAPQPVRVAAPVPKSDPAPGPAPDDSQANSPAAKPLAARPAAKTAEPESRADASTLRASGSRSEAAPVIQVPEPAPPSQKPMEPSAPLEARRPQLDVAPPAPSARPATTAHEIRLQVSGGERRVDVRLSERAGEVQVEVRTPDSRLTTALRDDLPALATRLQQTGFRTETWHPASSAIETREPATAATLPGGSANGEPSGRQGGQHPQQGEPRHPKPTAETQHRNSQPEEFSWLLSSFR